MFISLNYRQFALYIFWALLLFVVLFWRLGVPSFWDPDEAHYAETSRELLATRDWLVPYYNQQLFFDKPILFHLFQSISLRVFGATEFAARLVPALAALALVGVTWWLGAALVSTEVGLVAALLLTVNPGVFGLARYAILDTLFTAFLFAGVSCVSVAALRNRPQLQYPGYLFIGLAVLTKGPVAFALCGLAFLLALACSADLRRRLLALRWLLGFGIAVAVAAPWFVYMGWRFGPAFLQGYWLNENLLLFSRRLYAHQPPWYFYVQVLAASLLPWTALLVGRLIDDLRAISGRRGSIDNAEVLLWSWTVAIVAFFSVSRFKLDHYIFPVAPTVCLLCARAWADLRSASGVGTAGARVGFRLIGPTLVAAGVITGVALTSRLELPPPALSVPAALFIGGLALTARALRGGAIPRAPWISLAVLGFTYFSLLLWVVPAFEQLKVIPDLARWTASHAGEEHRVGAYRMNRWSAAFRFYVDRHTSVLESIDDARQFFDEGTPSLCVMTSRSYEEMVAEGIPLEIVHSRVGIWATSGRAFWRRRDPLTTFVVVRRAAPEARAPAYIRPPNI